MVSGEKGKSQAQIGKQLVAKRKLPFDNSLTDYEHDRLMILTGARKQAVKRLDTPEKLEKWLKEDN